MTYSPLSISRRHVLGDLYGRCDPIDGNIPVYLAGSEPELLGHADEVLGHYADAFSFHLADDICKRLSSGQYTYSFDYELIEPKKTGVSGRLNIRAITLTARKGYEKPIPRRASAALKQ
jgi:hypothetical protein